MKRSRRIIIHVTGILAASALGLAIVVAINYPDRNAWLVWGAEHNHALVARCALWLHADTSADDGNGWTALHWAVARRNKKIALALLKAGAMVDANDNHLMTPLHLAARNGDEAMADLLIAQGASASRENDQRHTCYDLALLRRDFGLVQKLVNHAKKEHWRPRSALAWAVDSGNKDLVLWMLQHGEDVNDDNGGPLETAAARGDLDLAKLLLAWGADVNRGTPLADAIRSNQPKLVELIINQGAKVNLGIELEDGEFVADPDETPMFVAARIPNLNPKILELLLAAGADVNFRDYDGKTALHVAAAGSDDCTLAELLLDHGADLNARDKKENTPLYDGICNPRMMECLLAQGGRLGEAGQGNLLHAAALRGCDDISHVIEKGLDVNGLNRDGRMPLHLAVASASAKSSSIPMLQLLQAGADINCRDRDGLTPLHLAVWWGHYGWGRDRVTNLLLQAGADVKARDRRGFTPLHYAAAVGSCEVEPELIARGARVNAQSKDGLTPLMIAAGQHSEGREALVKLLRNQGANLDEISSDGTTLLHCAAEGELFDLAEKLIKDGADVNRANRQGDTPLHFVAGSQKCNPIPDPPDWYWDLCYWDGEGCNSMSLTCDYSSNSNTRLAVLDLLLQAGAYPSRKNREGKAPLDLAQRRLAEFKANLDTARSDEMSKIIQRLEAASAPGTPTDRSPLPADAGE